jgi:TRAP-type C4-dicarboxylate transport system permease small subunit
MGDRLIGVIERAAGSLLALVTALTFVSVVLRYIFNWAIPDSYDLGRNLLGILIFWGIAVAGYRGAHITVDLLWNALPRRAQGQLGRVLDLVLALAMGALAWAMALKLRDTWASGETSYDLNLPLWPFQALAWVGFAVGFVLALLRLFRHPAAAETPPPRL